jgi:hypothetical protein
MTDSCFGEASAALGLRKTSLLGEVTLFLNLAMQYPLNVIGNAESDEIGLKTWINRRNPWKCPRQKLVWVVKESSGINFHQERKPDSAASLVCNDNVLFLD